MKILINLPGKLGDLFFSLPIAIQIKNKFDCDLYYQTSEYCSAVVPLLKSQPFIKSCFIDMNYVAQNNLCGLQPPDLYEPLDAFDHVYQLGFDTRIIKHPTLNPHLMDAHYETMEKRYGIKLEKYDGKYILVKQDDGLSDYVCFHGYAESVYFKLQKDEKQILQNKWVEILKYINKKIVVVCTKKENEFHNKILHGQGLKYEIINPKDLLVAAKIIQNSKMFIGVQSCPYVIADGMRKEILVFGYHRHVMPTGKDWVSFDLKESASFICKRIEDYLK